MANEKKRKAREKNLENLENLKNLKNLENLEDVDQKVSEQDGGMTDTFNSDIDTDLFLETCWWKKRKSKKSKKSRKSKI